MGCSGPKQLANYRQEAINNSSQQNYLQALKNWELYFNQTKNENISGEDFALAAADAYKGRNTKQAIIWFDQARYKSFSSYEMYKVLAEIYRAQTNISKELSALEIIKNSYPVLSSEIKPRLFDIYSEIEMNEKAIGIWNDLSIEDQSKEERILEFFKLNKNLGKSYVCDSLSLEILKNNPKQADALEWNAKKHYWEGQNRYEREMEKYNKNRTNSQYKRLLKELDIATADFKKALPFLKKLWEINPGKEYAGYLANIYARFGDEEKAAFYKKYMK